MKIQKEIERKLAEIFEPTHLEVINESHMHNVPPGSESHFKVIVVSNAFEGEKLIMRHQMVNRVLAEELKGAIHALTMVTKTPAQWSDDNSVPDSPACHGGGKTQA